jgi:plastocyanin
MRYVRPAVADAGRWLRFAVAAGASLLIACAPGGPAGADPVKTDRVAIVEPTGVIFRAWGYDPGAIRVPSGTTVTWRNEGAEFHTVTSDDPGRPFDIGLDPDQTATVTFATPGTFRYHCGVHPEMVGVVHVCDGACP